MTDKKPSKIECWSLECFDDKCNGDAPFKKENSKGDCLHICKKCGLKFWIRADGDVDEVGYVGD